MCLLDAFLLEESSVKNNIVLKTYIFLLTLEESSESHMSNDISSKIKNLLFRHSK